ncbi:O-antigen ligase family protein [Deinococcus arcticus]|uniref:O-antigen ligase-related domain-containing protein n=1 Tax=Deinococcus arcticus TaxID=2136176 RepID=A0A2T3W5G5_9DEIO|nr:O-antigen ligase family protein [Deinococcus arcticus]PTA67128.1 hypothetical protein C8263_14540 [Deinococcus arcticus]
MTAVLSLGRGGRWGQFQVLDLVIPLALALALFPGGVYVSLVLLLVLLFCGRIPDALAANVLLTLANPTIFDTSAMGLLRYIPLLLGMALLWPRNRVADLGVGWSLLSCAALLIFNAALVSQLPSISLFKGVLFILVLWVLFNTDRVDWEAFAFRVDRFIPLYLLLSLPVLAFPSIGFSVNGTGFQGITNQPQAFGVWMSLGASWLLYRSWNGRCALARPWMLLVLPGLLVCILLSEARTALLGFGAAALVTALIMIFRSPRRFGLRLLMALLVLAGGSLLARNNATLETFLFKRSQASDILGAAQASRGFLVERSLENFRAHPLLGIGFGVPSNPETAEISYAPVVGVPIAVALEKGVWISAALEEQGVVGTLALLCVFLALMTYAVVRRSWMALPMMLYFLTSNLGEMTMFSMGGTGQLQWLLLMTSLKLFEPGMTKAPGQVGHA